VFIVFLKETGQWMENPGTRLCYFKLFRPEGSLQHAQRLHNLAQGPKSTRRLYIVLLVRLSPGGSYISISHLPIEQATVDNGVCSYDWPSFYNWLF
jgi:hypothetical protein